MAGDQSLDEMLQGLRTTPDDLELRKRAVYALDKAGRVAEAKELLSAFVNFTGHDESKLPCLCRACLVSAKDEIDLEGLTFGRSFAVSGRHVLHFWFPQELFEERAAVRASVADALQVRLARGQK